ncbi:hypothetical protein [Streptomyces sp. NPDC002952]
MRRLPASTVRIHVGPSSRHGYCVVIDGQKASKVVEVHLKDFDKL